jgi:hypothetical protein
MGAKGVFSGRCMRRLYPERVYLKFLEMIGQVPKEKNHNIEKCPICGSTDYAVVNEIDFWDNGKIPKTTFAKCRQDGLVFTVDNVESIVYEEGYFRSMQKKYYENILSKEEIDRQISNARRVLDEYHKT